MKALLQIPLLAAMVAIEVAPSCLLAPDVQVARTDVSRFLGQSVALVPSASMSTLPVALALRVHQDHPDARRNL